MKLLHLRLKGNFVKMKRSSLIQTVSYRWYVQYDTILGIVGKKYVKSFSRNGTANLQGCAVAQNGDQGSSHRGAFVYICKKCFCKISWPYFGEPCKWGSYPPCLVRATLELGYITIIHRPVTHVTRLEGSSISLPFLRAEHMCCLTAAILYFAKGAFFEANRGKNHTLYLYLSELLICVKGITEVVFYFVFSFTVKEGSKNGQRRA